MSAKLTVVPTTCANDIPGVLRLMADQIDRGEYGEVHNIAWVMDHDGGVDAGLLGKAGEIGPTAHLLFAIAQRKLEGAI